MVCQMDALYKNLKFLTKIKYRKRCRCLAHVSCAIMVMSKYVSGGIYFYTISLPTYHSMCCIRLCTEWSNHCNVRLTNHLVDLFTYYQKFYAATKYQLNSKFVFLCHYLTTKSPTDSIVVKGGIQLVQACGIHCFIFISTVSW